MADLLPSPPINAQVNGLLSFFGIKNGGRNPETLSPTLIPTIDLLDWYQSNGSESAVGPGTTINSVGYTSLGLTVPNGEWWFVQHFTVITGAFTAGQGLTFAPMWADSQPTAVLLGAYSPTLSVGMAGAARADRTFWVPPGATLGAHVSTLALTPGLTGYLRYSRLRT